MILRLTRSTRRQLAVLLAIAVLILPNHLRAAIDPDFHRFLQSLWVDAQAQNISRATFDSATQGLEPDLTLPDLVIPGRVQREPGQAEFVQTPGQYLREQTFDRLAAQGQQLMAQHRTTLLRIEKEIGVPGNILLAIWGRETSFGGTKLPYDAIRTLATQAYTGRRKDMFRAEFIASLKMLQDGVPRSLMRSSWGGAVGLTQFLPTEYYKHATDFDGDGRIDLWNSVPDALASAAKQLAAKGWQPGARWGYEVRAPQNADCTQGVPEVTMPIGDWVARDFVPAYGRKLSPAELAQPASLLQPEGAYGPAFLAPKNYFVIKEYNFSDLYVLFVGHLSDRIAGVRAFEKPWSKSDQLRTAQVEQMQKRLTALGLYRDKLDGKAGMQTRAALGAYQKANGLTVDCWPTPAVLQHMIR